MVLAMSSQAGASFNRLNIPHLHPGHTAKNVWRLYTYCCYSCRFAKIMTQLALAHLWRQAEECLSSHDHLCQSAQQIGFFFSGWSKLSRHDASPVMLQATLTRETTSWNAWSTVIIHVYQDAEMYPQQKGKICMHAMPAKCCAFFNNESSRHDKHPLVIVRKLWIFGFFIPLFYIYTVAKQ